MPHDVVVAADVASSPSAPTGQAVLQQTPDTAAPQSTIGGGPAGTVAQSTAEFALASSEPGSTFECKLDAGDWAACTSPMTLTGLTDGQHTVAVRATDPAGNTDPTPATTTWTVDTTAPPTTWPDPGPVEGSPPVPARPLSCDPFAPTSTPAAVPTGKLLVALPGLMIATGTANSGDVTKIAVDRRIVALGQMTAHTDVRVTASLVASLPATSGRPARTAKRAVSLGRRTVTMKCGQTLPLNVRLPAKSRKRLAGRKRVRVVLTFRTIALSTGKSATKRRTLRLKIR